jgi:hypothetical protein
MLEGPSKNYPYRWHKNVRNVLETCQKYFRRCNLAGVESNGYGVKE